MKKKFIYLILVLSFLIGSIAGLQFMQSAKVNQAVAGIKTQSYQQPHINESLPLVSPTVLSQSESLIPTKLIIPKLNINTTVEQVGLDSKKNMDVPKKAMNAAWYQLGFKPGDKGNAVIAGHLDRKNGTPAVFYDLSKLVIGDIVTVVGEDGRKLDFRVTGKRTYEDASFPIETVFGDFDKSRLNLITCAGSYDGKTQEYTKRTVVFSELISGDSV